MKRVALSLRFVMAPPLDCEYSGFPDNEYLVAGKKVAAFTNDEERAVGLYDIVPFLLEDTLKQRGAEHLAAANFQPQVIVSERLVTGQNPASAKGVAEAMLPLLASIENRRA